MSVWFPVLWTKGRSCVRKRPAHSFVFKVALNLFHLILKIRKTRVFFSCKLSEGLRGRGVTKSPVTEVLLFLVPASWALYPSPKEGTEKQEKAGAGFVIQSCTN